MRELGWTLLQLDCIFTRRGTCFTLIFIIVWLPHNFVLVSAACQNESAVHNYIPAFFGFSSNSGHHRPLGGAPCAIKEVLIGLFYFYFFSLVCFIRSVDSVGFPGGASGKESACQ